MVAVADKIRDEKLQYNIRRETAEITALSYGKIDILKKYMNILQVKKYNLLIKEE